MRCYCLMHHHAAVMLQSPPVNRDRSEQGLDTGDTQVSQWKAKKLQVNLNPSALILTCALYLK